MDMTQHEKFMKYALDEAIKARDLGEVPVGAVIVKNDVVISSGHNKRETKNNALCHAEIEAIDRACEKLESWRLTDCDLYVTLEPCPMCTGAIINSRIKRVIFGTKDPKAGSCCSVINLFELSYNHRPQTVCGILESECSKLLSDFFKNLRENKN